MNSHCKKDSGDLQMLDLNNYRLIAGYAENARGMIDLKYSFRLGTTLSDIVIIDNVLIKDRFNKVAFDGSNIAALCENHENVLIQDGEVLQGYYKKDKEFLAYNILTGVRTNIENVFFRFSN